MSAEPTSTPRPAAADQTVSSANATDGQLADLTAEIRKLLTKIDSPKTKDRWDKLAILSSFFGTVLLASVGLIFTRCYDARQAAEQKELRVAQQRVAELDAISKLLPQLASQDSEQRAWGALVLQAIIRSDSGTKQAAARAPATAVVPESFSRLLPAFATLAAARSASSADRSAAVQALAAVAATRTTPLATRAQAESLVTGLAADSAVDPATRRVAIDALKELRALSVREVRGYVGAQTVSRPVTEVVLHHTWVPSIEQYQGASSIAGMLRFWVEERRNAPPPGQPIFTGAPWHFAVAPDGLVWVGRPLDRRPASVSGHNDSTVSVEIVMNGDKELPTRAQVQALSTLLHALFEHFRIDPATNFSPTRGFHRDYDTVKSCPGEKIDKRLVLQWLAVSG
jgi:hypothetical protein